MDKKDAGRIVWYELLTKDPKAAQAFYPEVIGWKTQAWEQADYTMWVGPHGPLGGVTELPAKAREMGAPSFWQANIQVANLDASVARVKELGGMVHHQEDVPNVGRLAVIQDPQGAVIALFQPEQAMPPRDLAKPGEFSWHELYTTDHEAAFAFYAAIAGWEKLGSFDMGPMGTYLLWGRDGQQLGGMMNKPPQVPAPAWLYYVTVDDLDAAMGRATAKGATVINGPMEVPGGQRIVQLLDPQGAAFALVTPPKS